MAGLWWFWFLRGHIAQGRAWIERALTGETGAPAAKPALAEALSARALARCRETGDARGNAYSLLPLQLAHIVNGEYELALSCAEESVTLCRAQDD